MIRERRDRVIVLLASLAIILIFSMHFGYPTSSIRSTRIDILQRDQAWTKELEKYPVTKGAIKLCHDQSIPNEKSENEGYYLNRCSNFCIKDDRFIYVTNTGENRIDKFDLNGGLINHFGTKGQGPEEFLTPKSIDIDGLNRLWIDDKGNKRIKILTEEGETIKAFKYFKTSSLMKVNRDDNKAYIHVRDIDPAAQLFYVMDERGEILSSFGDKKEFKESTPFHNLVSFSISRRQGLVVVAWKFFDTCRIYRKDGTLDSEFKVVHRAINKQTEVNLKARVIDNSVALRSLIEAVYAGEKFFYLLTCSPRMEILEVDYSGNIKNVYWYDTEVQYVGNDLYVIENGKGKRFIVMQSIPEFKVDIFSIQNRE